MPIAIVTLKWASYIFVALLIVHALKQARLWTAFKATPPLYQRVRVDNIQRVKASPEEYEKRLNQLIVKTREGVLYGAWDDYGRLAQKKRSRQVAFIRPLHLRRDHDHGRVRQYLKPAFPSLQYECHFSRHSPTAPREWPLQPIASSALLLAATHQALP